MVLVPLAPIVIEFQSVMMSIRFLWPQPILFAPPSESCERTLSFLLVVGGFCDDSETVSPSHLILSARTPREEFFCIPLFVRVDPQFSLVGILVPAKLYFLFFFSLRDQ